MKDHVRIPARLNGAVVSGIARDRPGDRCGTRTAAHLEFNELKLVRKYSGISNDGSKVHHLCIFFTPKSKYYQNGPYKCLRNV